MPTDPEQQVREKKGIRGLLVEATSRLRGGELSPRRIGLSVALGLWIGCSPFYGLHSVLASGLAFALRLDILLAYLASNISLPPIIPFLIFGEVQVGTWILEGRFLSLQVSELSPERALDLGAALGVGALILGTVVAVVGGLISFSVARYFEVRKNAGA